MATEKEPTDDTPDSGHKITAYEKVMTTVHTPEPNQDQRVPVQPTSTASVHRGVHFAAVPLWFWIAGGCAVVLAGMIGFLIGEHVPSTAKSSQSSTRGSSTYQQGTNSFGGPGDSGASGMGARRGARGTVTSVSSTAITIQGQTSGTTTTYTVNSSTTVLKSDRTSGSISDIQVGDEVMVQTSSTSAGSSSQQTAKSILDVGSSSDSSSSSNSTDSAPTTNSTTQGTTSILN